MSCKSPMRPFMRKQPQQGLVLFFAMLALVVMSIAAVALIRSVDTNSLISANMVFRQSATTASNVAIEVVTKTVSQTISVADSVTHHATQGYYANCSQFDTTPANQVCDGKQLTSVTWTDANSRLVPDQTDGNNELRNGVDRQGNTIRYIVERMCNFSEAEIAAGTASSSAARCMMASAASDGQTCSKNQSNMELFKACVTTADTPLYRVTLRIAGPKNTVSYMQTFISN